MGGRCALPVALIFAAGVASLAATTSGDRLELRLVAVMHENLAAINGITEAIAREDFERVGKQASHLRSSAEFMRNLDLAAVGLDPQRNSLFDDFVAAQVRSVDAIASGAQSRNAQEILVGVERLFDEACVACHTEFREVDTGRTPPVLFMRTLLSSVGSINRGIVMNDYALVAREAREIGAMAQIFTWTQVIEGLFTVKDPAERIEFRNYFENLSTQAIQIEGAAMKKDARLIAQATRRMMQNGCVACHEKFRRELKER
jgi:mono/diheme cytochrome c family protein